MVEASFITSFKEKKMQNKNIIEAIDHWGKVDPERIAYKEKDRCHTYGELYNQSNRLAAYLIKNIKRKQPIIVYGQLQFDMLVCFLAASKAGNAYIPIDAHTPEERIEMILSMANPAMILAVDSWQIATDIPIISSNELVVIQKEGELIKNYQPVTANETYYIIFTSGTTGTPKGVQISHKNLLSFVNWELNDFNIEEGMNFLSQAPYSFDLSVMDIYPALVSGGSLSPLSREIVDDFKQLFTTLFQLNLEVWVSTPSFVDICLMEPTFNGEQMPELKVFLFCGEELPKLTAKKLLERFPKSHVFNTYGPTETTVAISGIEITDDILAEYKRLPIGYVKQDTNIYIMEEDKELSLGEVGEIIIAGPSVSKGYMNNPLKTEEAFFNYKEQQAYHTGDAGKILPSGLLIYEGRMDFQIKFHGYRIELEDIDHHLADVSYVEKATIVPKYNNHKVQQLIAFVVVKEQPFEREFQLTKAIKEELSQTVMDYMIPQKFIYVDQLPLTTNGKIDRKGLINEVNAT